MFTLSISVALTSWTLMMPVNSFTSGALPLQTMAVRAKRGLRLLTLA
eukprot:CAMPEP_0197486680 /NCGR_PEP_ID=MMETSP1311-20131121/1644_1 /TAXON_ID=464262 /ORGANISM="Genus nov. species nov., Strain RCC856" /LENGTH=46 /DNA_ID= /DNA_START= /DNA_END= /DNA_ORIENTATION=